jgi:hypothetical protein
MVIKLHGQERQRGKIGIYVSIRQFVYLCMTLSYDYMPEVI